MKVHPIRTYIKHSEVGRKTYFQAIYPDISVTRGCVNFHNGHPNSPKKVFFLDDMMGGIIVSLQVLEISKVVGLYHSGLEHTLT